MGLKAVVENLEEVPEGVRDFYEEQEGGGYALAVEGLESDGPTEKDLKEVKAALARANKEAGDRRKAIQQWEALGKSPEEISELLEAQEEAEQRKAEQKGEWEKLRTQLQEKHTQALGEKDEVIAGLEKQLDRLIIDHAIVEGASEHEGFADLLPKHARDFIRIEQENGSRRAIVVDEKGERRINDDGSDMTISELVGWMKTQERYHPLFKGNGVAGGGAGGGSGAGGAGHRKSLKDMTEQEKMDFIDQHGQEEYEKKVMAEIR